MRPNNQPPAPTPPISTSQPGVRTNDQNPTSHLLHKNPTPPQSYYNNNNYYQPAPMQYNQPNYGYSYYGQPELQGNMTVSSNNQNPNAPVYQNYPVYPMHYGQFTQPPPPIQSQPQSQYYYPPNNPGANNSNARYDTPTKNRDNNYGRNTNNNNRDGRGGNRYHDRQPSKDNDTSRYSNRRNEGTNRNNDKPIDPRKKNEAIADRSSQNSKKQLQSPQKPPYNPKPSQQQSHQYPPSQQSQPHQSSQDEQLLYQKSKAISKKRDPILDSPSQIRKWVEARRRNYPTLNRTKAQAESLSMNMSAEMSILESKIRKKIMFVTSDGKGLMKKLKNMYILRRLVAEPGLEYGDRDRRREGRGGKGRVQEEKIRRIRRAKVRCLGKVEEEKEKQNDEQKQREKVLNLMNEEVEKQSNSNIQQSPIQKPIIKESLLAKSQPQPQLKPQQDIELQPQSQPHPQKTGLTPQDMISHLRQKQKQDTEFYGQLLNYNTNSLNYKYSAQTLETSFVLEDIFQESSYLLQIVRYLVKNNFMGKGK